MVKSGSAMTTASPLPVVPPRGCDPRKSRAPEGRFARSKPADQPKPRVWDAAGYRDRARVLQQKLCTSVELTESGRTVANRVIEMWSAPAEETPGGLPARTVAERPACSVP